MVVTHSRTWSTFQYILQNQLQTKHLKAIILYTNKIPQVNDVSSSQGDATIQTNLILIHFSHESYVNKDKSLYADIDEFPKYGNKFYNTSTHFWHGFFSREQYYKSPE